MCWLYQWLISTWTSLLFNDLSNDLLRCIIYHVQMSGVRVAQNCLISSFSSSRFIGLYTFRKYCLSEPHIFSMGRWLRGCVPPIHTMFLEKILYMATWMFRIIILLQSVERSLRNGSKPASYTIAKRSAFIIPVKITTLVAPLFDMPSQMCTFTRCLACCLRSRSIRHLQKHSLLCCSSWTVDWSMKSTSSKFSLALNCSLHQINLFLVQLKNKEVL